MTNRRDILLISGLKQASNVGQFISNTDENCTVKIYSDNTNIVNNITKQLQGKVRVEKVSRKECDMIDLIAAKGQAYDHVEAVYQSLYKQGMIPTKWFSQLYGNEKIELVFKKQLIELIEQWLAINYFANKFSTEGNRVRVLVDREIYEIAHLLDQVKTDKLDFTLYCCDDFKVRVQSIKYLLQFVLVPFYILSKIKYTAIKCKIERKIYDVGIRLHSGIRKGNHALNMAGYDVLAPYLKDKAEILYVAENKLSSVVADDLQNKSNTFTSLDHDAFQRVSVKYLFFVIFSAIKNIFFAPVLFYKSSFLFYELLPKIWFDYFRWTGFTQQNQICWYCSFTNEGKGHITRNIILQKSGIKTLCYAGSSTGCYFLDKSRFNDLRKPQKAFSYYDSKAYICGRQREYDLAQGAIVCSSFISGMLENPHKIESYRHDIGFFQASESKDKTIVSLFSTSAQENTLNGETELLEFFFFIQKILNDIRCDEYIFLLKLKNPVHSLSQELAGEYEKLLASGRVVDVGDQVSAALIIGISDFVLSMAFTSPTLEAISLRIPACFVLPSSWKVESVFVECTEILVRNTDDLVYNFEFFSGLTNDEFDCYYTDKIPLNCVKNIDQSGIEKIADYLVNN